MAFAETAPLVAQLRLDDKFSGPLKRASGALSGFNIQAGKIGAGMKTIGAGIGVAARNIVLLGAAVAGGLAAGLLKSVREGQEAAKVQVIYANAIANSGKVSAEYVQILNKQQKALMNLAGIDDELIKSSQTRLIQMGLTGDQVAKITPLVLDFAKATGIDLETATKLVGKSINGNTGALSRYGVMVDKTKAKVDPFAATQDALNKRFAGTTKALSGGLDARLGALRENLANVREEAGMKLLPALTRIVDVLGKDLVPAFGKFVDRIMPSVTSGIEQFASALENGGAERGIKAISDALGPMVELLKLAAGPAKAIVQAFLSLPPQVQGILVGGFALNKLSGGLIGAGVGQVVGGLFQRGSSPGNPLFVTDVTGGLGKGVLGNLVKGGALTVALTAASILAMATALAVTVQGDSPTSGDPNKPPTPENTDRRIFEIQRRIESLRRMDPTARAFPGSTTNMSTVAQEISKLTAELTRLRTGGLNITPGWTDKLRKSATAFDAGAGSGGRELRSTFSIDAAIQRGLAAGFKPTRAAAEATVQRNLERLAAANLAATNRVRDAADRGAGAALVTAAAVQNMDRKPPITNVEVNVNVTAAQVNKSVVIQQRFGPSGGSRERGAMPGDSGV